MRCPPRPLSPCLPGPLPDDLDPSVELWLVSVARRGLTLEWQRYYALARCADPATMTVVADRETWLAGGGGRYFPVLAAVCRHLAENGFLAAVPGVEGLPTWQLTFPPAPTR